MTMLPFIERLAHALNKIMPEKIQAREKSMYLTDSSIELPDTAIASVRKETLRLYDNAFEIIAHGLNFHRSVILSGNNLANEVHKSSRLITIDFDAEYDRSIKGLYSEIIYFISRAQAVMTPEQSDELFSLRAAGRDIVEAIKDIKHMYKNLSHYIVSDNQYIQSEYDKLRMQLGKLMRELNHVRNNGDDPVAILSLSSLKLDMDINDSTSNGKLEQLIRENKISAKMATSLMNDSSYAYDVAKNLIQMGEILFSTSDMGMKSVEKDIALTADEVAEIISDTSSTKEGTPHETS